MKVSELFESPDEQKHLEKMVRDALDKGDDYTAKQCAKMSPTPEGKKALTALIKQIMYAPVNEAKAKALVSVTARKNPNGTHGPTGTFTVKAFEVDDDSVYVKISENGGWGISLKRPPEFLKFTLANGQPITLAQAISVMKPLKEAVDFSKGEQVEGFDLTPTRSRKRWAIWGTGKDGLFYGHLVLNGPKDWGIDRRGSTFSSRKETREDALSDLRRTMSRTISAKEFAALKESETMKKPKTIDDVLIGDQVSFRTSSNKGQGGISRVVKKSGSKISLSNGAGTTDFKDIEHVINMPGDKGVAALSRADIKRISSK